jgi:hypothetical protein
MSSEQVQGDEWLGLEVGEESGPAAFPFLGCQDGDVDVAAEPARCSISL